MNTKSMLLAAGLGGVAMALVSSIPIINCTNCLCWAGIWGCGILTIWIYRLMEKSQPGLTIGQGVALGLIAGVVGAVLVSIWGVISSLIFGAVDTSAYLNYLNQIPGMADSLDQTSRQMIEQYAATSGNVLFSSVCNFVLYPLFGLIGGLIGTALIWKK